MNVKNLIMWFIIVLLSVGLFNMFQDPKKINSERNSSYPQFSDHYFTGDYPIRPLDNLEGLKIKQLSLLSGKSNN